MLRLIVSTAIMLLLSWPQLASAQGREMTGSWKGVVTGADGTSAEVYVDFSQQGFPLYSYTNNQGIARQVELSQVGQTIEYVPPGGGVQRVEVRAIEREQGRLSIAIVGSFEKSNQGYLDQHYEGALFEYGLVPGGLKMRVTTQSTSHFGDKDTIVSGQPNAAVAEGVLQRIR